MTRADGLEQLRKVAERVAIDIAFVTEEDTDALTELALAFEEMAKAAKGLARPGGIAPIAPEQAALITINEAISVLDHDSDLNLPSDDMVEEAMSALLVARECYSAKAWPELPAIDAERRMAWLTARAEEQRKDGRL